MDFLSPDIQQYIEKMSSPEPEALARLNRETHLKVLYPQMLSGHYQGRVLSFLSGMIRPEKILEIGTFTGYSAICLAEGLAPGGKLYTIELNPELEPMIRRGLQLAGVEDRVELNFGPALEIIPRLAGPFDLVFIDADKSNYRNYFEMVLPRLSPHGVILADNVLWSGRIFDPLDKDKETAGIRDFSSFVQQDLRVEQVILPVRDGLMILRKKGE
ncbi:MAG: O-methyltransferase [Bacteroidia bacterium]|nr:O-methyltransferase [Bacteroidia bacterium]